MNFLQIAQRIRQEMGTGGLGPATLLAQFGEDKQYTDWTREAYIDVLNYARDWNFLWEKFQFVGNGGREYNEAAHGVIDVGTWNVDTFYALQNEVLYPLHFVPWDEFRLYQASVMVNGLPASFSIQPGGTLVFDAAPQASVTIGGEYFIKPDTEILADGQPVFPERYHMIVVWRGLMLAAAFYAEPDKYAHGENMYTRLLAQMTARELPAIRQGRPLA